MGATKFMDAPERSKSSFTPIPACHWRASRWYVQREEGRSWLFKRTRWVLSDIGHDLGTLWEMGATSTDNGIMRGRGWMGVQEPGMEAEPHIERIAVPYVGHKPIYLARRLFRSCFRLRSLPPEVAIYEDGTYAIVAQPGELIEFDEFAAPPEEPYRVEDWL